MTDFITLSYTSAREIPTLSYTGNLKKVPLLGGSSPYRPESPSPWHNILSPFFSYTGA